MQAQVKAPRIERGKIFTEIEVKYLTLPEEIGAGRVVFPGFGPRNYKEVGQAIRISKDDNGRHLIVPTGEQLADLVHVSYIGEPEFLAQEEPKNARQIIKNGVIWVHSRPFYVPKEFSPINEAGVYVEQDYEARGIEQMSIEQKRERIAQLEKQPSGSSEHLGVRFSKDKSVAFAPEHTIRLGEQTSGDLARNGLVIATYSPEGAEKLASVSSLGEYFHLNPHVSGLDTSKLKAPEQSFSALGGGWGGWGGWGFGRGLYLRGCYWGDDADGYGFGVSDGEAVVQKNKQVQN